jgi:uncharacterized protein YcfL
MKKIVVLLAIVALASCGGGTTSETKSTDSTEVRMDSTVSVDSIVSVDETFVLVDTAEVN